MKHMRWKISVLFVFCLAGSVVGFQSCSDRSEGLRDIASVNP